MNLSRRSPGPRVIGHAWQARMVRSQVEQGNFEALGARRRPEAAARGRDRGGPASLVTAICASSRPVNVLVMEPISKKIGLGGAVGHHPPYAVFGAPMTMPAPPSAAARSSRRSMGAISRFITEGKSATCTGGIGGSKARAGAGVESYCASTSGQAIPASPCTSAA